MSDSGQCTGEVQSSDVHDFHDFLSHYMTKSATPSVNGLLTPERGSHKRNGSPPALAFSPSPSKVLDDASSPNSSFCHRLNVDDCVAYLDQEVTTLGFGSLLDRQSRNLDIVKLINSMHGLLEKLKSGQRIREDLENRQRRNESDLENLQLSQHRLKELLVQRDREVQQALESERQMKNKLKKISDLLKAEKDEVRKLNSMIQHKDAQYKHELKKKEREHHKLKENLQSRRTDRNAERQAGMEISETLQRPDGKRARWKTQDRHDDDLYKTVILDYEEKHKELLAENYELRQCLKNLQKEMTNATSQTNLDNSLSLSDSDNLSDDLDSVKSSPSDYDISDGLFEMPFPMVRTALQRSFKKRLKYIRLMMKHLQNQGESEENIGPESGQGDTEVERLRKQLDRYHHIIQQQEQFIQDRLESGHESMDSSMLRDSYLYDEYDALEQQRRRLLHEQALINEERDYLAKTKKQLIHQQYALDEQTNLAKNQFFEITPFQNKHKAFTASSQKTKPRKQRLLPSTPKFMTPGPVKSPSTAQLYKFLGLKQHSKYRNASDSEDDHSVHETASNLSSLRASLFSTPSVDSRNQSPVTSPIVSARINEHVENIKMTLLQKKKSPHDSSS